MQFLLAPTEHDLKRLSSSVNDHTFTTSSLPEKHGCDVLAVTKHGIAGFQRKTLPDLVSSLFDGRLYKELSQLQASATVTHPFLILEYDPSRRTTANDPIDSEITLTQLRSLITKFSLSNVATFQTYDHLDTLSCCINVARYISSNTTDVPKRPKQTSNQWGQVTSESYALYFLQSFPSIGPSLAKAIYTKFGVPLRWTVSESELATVPGLGPKRARALIDALPPVTGSTPTPGQ